MRIHSWMREKSMTDRLVGIQRIWSCSGNDSQALKNDRNRTTKHNVEKCIGPSRSPWRISPPGKERSDSTNFICWCQDIMASTPDAPRTLPAEFGPRYRQHLRGDDVMETKIVSFSHLVLGLLGKLCGWWFLCGLSGREISEKVGNPLQREDWHGATKSWRKRVRMVIWRPGRWTLRWPVECLYMLKSQV
jgi:hypothetical protein